MNWKVSWSVTVTEPAPCPDFVPDPITGAWPTSRCLVYHTQQTTLRRSATFETEDEANVFVAENAKKYPDIDFQITEVDTGTHPPARDLTNEFERLIEVKS